MSFPEHLGFLNYLQEIFEEDRLILIEKGQTYGDSWLKRGGDGAFHATMRKLDRLENIAKKYHNDIFTAYSETRNDGDASFFETVADLRRYLALWEAEGRRRGFIPSRVSLLASQDPKNDSLGMKPEVAQLLQDATVMPKSLTDAAEHLLKSPQPKPAESFESLAEAIKGIKAGPPAGDPVTYEHTMRAKIGGRSTTEHPNPFGYDDPRDERPFD